VFFVGYFIGAFSEVYDVCISFIFGIKGVGNTFAYRSHL
jgi:hypothetical protein